MRWKGNDKSKPTKGGNIKGHKYRGDTTHGKVWTLTRRWTGNISNTKTQQVFHKKSVFEELGLVMKITTSTKTQLGENHKGIKKDDDAKYAKV